MIAVKQIKISKIITGVVIILSPSISKITITANNFLSPMSEVYFALSVLTLTIGSFLIGSSFWKSDNK
jgi:hypothetical protein